MKLNCKCKICNKNFHLKPFAIKRGRGKYCSKVCFNFSKKGKFPFLVSKGTHNSINTEFKKGIIPWNKGTKGIIKAWNKGIKGQQAWNKGKHNWWFMGDKNPNWKGGVSDKNRGERRQAMSTLKYKEWRRNVFERDNYMCIQCGSKKSGTLQADHIKPWALYPKLRYAIDNGRTLCINCHRKTFIFMGNQFTTAGGLTAPVVALSCTFLFK